MEPISLVMEKCLGGRKFYELDTAICRYDGRSESVIWTDLVAVGDRDRRRGNANHIPIVQ